MRSKNFSGFELLTKNEQALYIELSARGHDSLWGIAIHNVVVGGDACTFRRLVSQLKSQADDDERTMQNIIGEQAYQMMQGI